MFLMRLSLQLQDIQQDSEDLHHGLRILWTVKGGIRFSEGKMLCIHQLTQIIVIVILSILNNHVDLYACVS